MKKIIIEYNFFLTSSHKMSAFTCCYQQKHDAEEHPTIGIHNDILFCT